MLSPRRCAPGCECECHPPSPWPRFWRIVGPVVALAYSAWYLYCESTSYPDCVPIPAAVSHDSEHHLPFSGVVWYRVSGGLVGWFILYYPWSSSRMGWNPIGILAQIMLGLIQATIVSFFAFFHLYGLVTSLDLFGLLPEALARHLRWKPLMEKKSRFVRFVMRRKARESEPQGGREVDDVTYVETNAEEFGLPLYDESCVH